ncbi:uncharacterized protein FIESC28_01051 [Fusarium coffeatum]|uniref:Uncharacterized protein n=1 Tax=Fusarium coffeatum TaxID=231269 RepID=A0A366SBQ5_9HYPO|nr:uncharacterized protein FIESC28_01051 [Fusarium coffeatum]RBR26160.1 hypothetical protein FIESC28_01051 [Fusarium coffeatum]
MADHIEEMIENCCWPELDTKRYPGGRKNPNNIYRYRKWGYTVYRTYYSKESDEAWAMLLYSLEHQTKLALSGFGEEGVDDDDVHVDQDDVQQLRNLFTIEGLEDPSKFEGLDVQGVRDFWSAQSLKMKQAVVQIPGKRRRLTTRPWETEAMADCVHDFVLLADEATLKDVANGLFVVKAVSLELLGAAGWSGGWMRIPTSYLLDLWFLLCDWPSRPENALSFSGSEEELHYWIWPGDDNRCIRTARYSEVRKFPHYNGQTYHEDLWRKRRAPLTERCDEEGSSDSSLFCFDSSDDDGPLH